MAAKNTICIQTLFVAFLTCLAVVGSLEQYEPVLRVSLPVEVQSRYINNIIEDSLSRQKRQARAFFSNKGNGGSNTSPNAINIYKDDDYTGNADFAFPGQSFRPDNYPTVENESYNNQFVQTSPNSGLIQENFNNQQTNNVPWQNTDNWLNPNFNYEARNPNRWQNQNNNNNWNSQQNNNQGWGQDTVASSTPGSNNRASPPNACQLECRRYVTGEYNPICGSDGVTYLNPARFKCAVKCGKQITGKSDRTCGLGAPVA